MTDAGSLVKMTNAEKQRLKELMDDEDEVELEDNKVLKSMVSLNGVWTLLASERSERDTLRSVQSRIAIYVVRMSHLPFDP